MDKITVIINEGPAVMRSWNGIRLAGGLADVNTKTEVILFDEAVFCAKKDQKGMNPARKLSELIDMGIKVMVCESCCEVRGLKKEEVIPGAEVSCMMDIANAIKTSKQTLVF